ncbi:MULTISPECIES: TadE/TadG family type IV pilus assembly protein [unclassified Nocardioides]|uniref:TadE/TadG family type IV pilus assembly protein n=1 Tax=unclassified Nocardioides TaxID=2615069 RepID=UPI000056F4B7|nr:MULTISPECIES: TadE/TadG family type IV pilus assembly protein [unclassified Nocardioides]
MTRPPTTTADWRDAIDSFSHNGPGGDEALAAQHPDLMAALQKLTPDDEPLKIGGGRVTRQTDGSWRVGRDRNLASPWVVVQSLRSSRHRYPRHGRSWRERLRVPRDERGYAAVELLAMTTVLVGFITVVVGGGRIVDSNSQVDDAAYAAARAASLESNFEAGQIAGRDAAADSLADRGKACTHLTVSFAGTDFRTSGHVRVEVTCHANLSDVVGFGLPGAKDFTSTAVVPIEQYRRLP